jgi:hypothetical protein
LFALALLLANGVACSPQIRNERKPLGMIPVNPESRSIVLRAPVIFLFRLENAQAGDAASASGGTHLVRPVQLTIRILEIFKGELDEQPGTSVSLKISQSERGPGRQYALPGVWSGLSLAPGGEYIAFSRTASRSAAVVAGDEGCQRIFPASEALADLRIALAAENSGRPIGEILQMALPVASQIGYLLAEYLSVKTMDLQLPDPLTFGFLMDLMEARALHETPRITFLDDAYAKVIDSDRPLPRIVNRFVVALLRVLAIPEAAEYRSRILEDYLPHALRLDDKENIRKSVDVLSSYPNDRVLAARVLSGSPRLLAWLNAR